MVGDDSLARLIQYFSQKKLDTSHSARQKLVQNPFAGWAHTVGQQVLRVDRERKPRYQTMPAELSHFCSVKKRRCLAISDYASVLPTPLVLKLPPEEKYPITLDITSNLIHLVVRGFSATPNS